MPQVPLKWNAPKAAAIIERNALTYAESACTSHPAAGRIILKRKRSSSPPVRDASSSIYQRVLHLRYAWYWPFALGLMPLAFVLCAISSEVWAMFTPCNACPVECEAYSSGAKHIALGFTPWNQKNVSRGSLALCATGLLLGLSNVGRCVIRIRNRGEQWKVTWARVKWSLGPFIKLEWDWYHLFFLRKKSIKGSNKFRLRTDSRSRYFLLAIFMSYPAIKKGWKWMIK